MDRIDFIVKKVKHELFKCGFLNTEIKTYKDQQTQTYIFFISTSFKNIKKDFKISIRSMNSIGDIIDIIYKDIKKGFNL
ncbi:MAG: hypothetical protein RR500_04835 [Bacilli bacterium]